MVNIQFNNIKEIGLPISAMPVGVKGLTEDLIAENGGIINAVQIDWNAANLGKEVEVNLDGTPSEGNSAVINTTGRMLSCLSTLA